MMLPKKENLTVEFKSDRPSLSDHVLIDEAVAMANAEGGTIYIGVENDGTVTGASKEHQDAMGVLPLIANKTYPSLYVDANVVLTEGKPVLVVSVPKKNTIISTASGRTVRRALKANDEPEIRPFFPWEFNSRLSDLGLLDKSADPIHPYDESLLDMSLCHRLHEELTRKEGADVAIAGLDFEEFLFATGCITLIGGIKMLTFTGLLLFGIPEALSRTIPSCLFRFQWMENGVVRNNEQLRMNVYEAFAHFASFLSMHNPNDEFLYQMRRIDVPRFSVQAAREAFANAVAHRDYSLLAPIRVLIDETGLTISSPGPFIRGLSEKDLLSAEPHGRNPALSYALKLLGFCESSGRGVDKIYASAATYGKTMPEYRCVGEDVTVYFPDSSIDEPFASFLYPHRLPLLTSIALALLRKNGPLSFAQIATSLGIGPAKAEGILYVAMQQGLVRTEGGKVALTTLKTNDASTPSEDEIDAKILQFGLQNGGYLTREDIEQRFLVSSSKAYRMLQGLIQKGKIVLEASGRHARYRILND